MNAQFDGKTILVTGASRGIGEGIARHLLHLGASVIGTYNTGADEARALTDEFDGRLRMLKTDLSDPLELSALVRDVAEVNSLGGIVNNAGAIDFHQWDDFTIESWNSVFAVNVTAPLVLVHGLRTKLDAGSAVVNIASTDGFTGSFGSFSYSASKAALINLTKSLGNLLAERGVRVNAVAPGWINTGMSTDASYAAAKVTPMGRNGSPEDVAGVVAFLLSDAAAFITGTTLTVDGGYTNVDTIMKQEYQDLLTES